MIIVIRVEDNRTVNNVLEQDMTPQFPLKKQQVENETPILDFSSIIWYGAEIELLASHLKDRLAKLLKSYPEPDASTIRMMIARRQELHEDEIIVTNGPTAAFHLIARAFANSNVLIHTPTMKALDNACKIYGCKVNYVDDSSKIDEWPLEGVDICFITTPNPPDGRIISHADLIRTFKQYPKTMFVVNQSYASFSTTNKLRSQNINIYPNVVMIWSFSQPYGIPGLRIGYITAPRKYAQELWKVYTPSVVTSDALEAAKYILIHPAQFTLPIRKWLRNAQELIARLRQFDFIEVIPSDTTFFLIRLADGKAKALRTYLREEHNIAVGDSSTYLGMDDDYLSITARSEEDNEKLISAIQAWTDTCSEL